MQQLDTSDHEAIAFSYITACDTDYISQFHPNPPEAAATDNTLLSPPTVYMDSTEVHLKVEGPGGMESSPLHSTQVYSSPLKGTGGNGVHSSPVHSTQVQTSPLKGRGGNGVQSSPVLIIE